MTASREAEMFSLEKKAPSTRVVHQFFVDGSFFVVIFLRFMRF